MKTLEMEEKSEKINKVSLRNAIYLRCLCPKIGAIYLRCLCPKIGAKSKPSKYFIYNLMRKYVGLNIHEHL